MMRCLVYIAAICGSMMGGCTVDAARVQSPNLNALDKSQGADSSVVSALMETHLSSGPPRGDCKTYMLADWPKAERATIQEHIKDTANTNCQGKIGLKYAMRSIEVADSTLVSMDLSDKGNFRIRGICGFVTLKEQPTSLHIDLICSHMGYGKLLLQRSDAHGIAIGKPFMDLEAVPAAREFYEFMGYRHCSDPCSSKCNPVAKRVNMKIANGLYIMKKCINEDLAKAPYSETAEHSEEVSQKQDLTPFFTLDDEGKAKSDGKEHWYQTNETKMYQTAWGEYRCCCRAMGFCHVVLEGRDELPLFWRTGLGGCGKYIASSHSWNHWGSRGKCLIAMDSLNSFDNEVFNQDGSGPMVVPIYPYPNVMVVPGGAM